MNFIQTQEVNEDVFYNENHLQLSMMVQVKLLTMNFNTNMHVKHIFN